MQMNCRGVWGNVGYFFPYRVVKGSEKPCARLKSSMREPKAGDVLLFF